MPSTIGFFTALFGIGVAVKQRQQPIAEGVLPFPPEVSAPVAAANDRPRLRPMRLHQICGDFLNWMRDEGSYGYHTVEEIDTFIDYFCASVAGTYTPDPNTARSMLNEFPGVISGRHRLKTQFPEIYASTGRERCVLYRISSHRELEQEPKTQRSRMEMAPVRTKPRQRPRPAGMAAGHNPGHGGSVAPTKAKRVQKTETYEIKDAA